MNEELENVLSGDAPQNQNGEAMENESESSVVGVIFTVLAWLNLIVGVIQLIVEKSKSNASDYSFGSYDPNYTFGFTLIGSSLFLFAVASCLKFLAKISSRMGRIMRAVEK